MELHDATELIRRALPPSPDGKLWADLGSGKGLFAYALASLLGPGSTIHAVDNSAQTIDPTFHGNRIVFHQLDFSKDTLPFTQLDGILMANSLHFIEEKFTFLSGLKKLLREEGRLVIIEYEMDKGNAWVPYPIPQVSLKAHLKESGFTNISLAGERQSVYGRRKMYVCVAANGKK